MNLFFKFFILIIKRFFDNSEFSIEEACVTKLRVDLFDIDFNLHMNNGRYLSVMDLGRLDLILRTKKFLTLFKRGYFPVVLSESIIFKKSLAPFQRYELHTKITSWDDKFFYFTQTFMDKEEIAAVASVRACFKQRKRKGIVPTKEIIAFFDIENHKDELTELAEKQKEIDLLLLPRD